MCVVLLLMLLTFDQGLYTYHFVKGLRSDPPCSAFTDDFTTSTGTIKHFRIDISPCLELFHNLKHLILINGSSHLPDFTVIAYTLEDITISDYEIKLTIEDNFSNMKLTHIILRNLNLTKIPYIELMTRLRGLSIINCKVEDYSNFTIPTSLASLWLKNFGMYNYSIHCYNSTETCSLNILLESTDQQKPLLPFIDEVMTNTSSLYLFIENVIPSTNDDNNDIYTNEVSDFSDMFRNLFYSSFETVVSIEKERLKSIPEFGGAYITIVDLALGYNNIPYMCTEQFYKLTNLEYIDLSGNPLKDIWYSSLQTFDHLGTLFIDDIAFPCINKYAWLKESSIIRNYDTNRVCSYPQHLITREWRSLTSDDFVSIEGNSYILDQKHNKPGV